MSKAPSHREPSRSSLREMPEVDFAAHIVQANPFAERIAAEGIELSLGRSTERDARREREPSAESLREIPEVDFERAQVRANPYARRIAAEGITLQVGRGRPKRGDEIGPTVPRSIRLPANVWKMLEQKAKERGLPLHAVLRAAVLEWLRRVA